MTAAALTLLPDDPELADLEVKFLNARDAFVEATDRVFEAEAALEIAQQARARAYRAMCQTQRDKAVAIVYQSAKVTR